jgi:hypothetical protein
MNTTIRALLIALLAVSVAACQDSKEDEEAAARAAAASAPLTAPVDGDDTAWGNYLTDVVRRNLGNTVNSPYLYYLPSEDSADFEGEYERLREKATADVQRGILEGNMLAFGSPASSRMAGLIVDAFSNVQAASMPGVRVLFIGKAEDSERARAAVEPTGAEYLFVEAK